MAAAILLPRMLNAVLIGLKLVRYFKFSVLWDFAMKKMHLEPGKSISPFALSFLFIDYVWHLYR